MGIFGDNAPRYYSAGLPAIPLRPSEKRPWIDAWSSYALAMPSSNEREHWLEVFDKGNIGMPAGPASGLCFLDIDTDDPKAIQVIHSLIPKSPWKRVGKKGMVYAYKFTGHKAFQIKLAAQDGQKTGSVICELLSIGRQVVLPPSIHPDTNLPYEANCELLDVLDAIPTITKEIETLLRAGLEEAGFNLSHSGWTRVLNYVSMGSRDNEVTSMAGLYANAVTRGERTLKQAVDEFRAWHGTFVERVAGDDVPVEKGVERIIHFINRDLTGPKKRVLPKGWDADLSEDEKASLGLEVDDEVQEWSFEQLKLYLKGEFDLNAADDQGRMAAVTYALERIHRSPSMDTMQVEILLDWMSAASRLALSKTVLKKRLKEMKNVGISGENQTEIAKAALEEYGDLRYHNENFWKWCGSHWEEVDQDDIQRFIAENYGHLPAVKKAHDLKGVMQVMSKLCKKTLKGVAVEGVNFANGVLGPDLKLRPHDPVWGMNYTLPFRYVAQEHGEFKEPVMFLKFLHDCWGHSPDFHQRVMAIQEALCVTLFGIAPEYMRAILLFGMAHSGKSQLLNIARALVPDNMICSIAPTLWGERFEPAQMANKLLNVGGELSETKIIDGMLFKQIVEGSEIPAQHKGKQIFHFRPRCAHWFASNYLPKTRDTSEGFNRRWLIFMFDKVVAKEARTINISAQIIADEREAIVAWAVQALPRLKKNEEYTIPKSHESAIQEMAGENDSVRFFMQASGRVKIAPKLSVIGSEADQNQEVGEKISHLISARMLHAEYSSYCITLEGARPVGFRKFCQRMRELGSVLGFKQVIERIETNLEDVCFLGIIVVDAQGRILSTSMKMNSKTTLENSAA